MLKKIEGIIIKSLDYGETNKIITIYTREIGKISVMARGAKKPTSRLGSVTQLFTYGNFLVKLGKGMGTLKQGEIISFMKNIRQDITLTAYSFLAIELTDKLTENKESNPYLFELLYQTLSYIEEEVDPEILIFIYQLKLLPLSGVKPSFEQCQICQQEQQLVAFSFREGGFLCNKCIHKDQNVFPLTETVTKLIKFFYYIDIKRIGTISVKKENKDKIRFIINKIYEDNVGIHLKANNFIKQLDLLSLSK